MKTGTEKQRNISQNGVIEEASYHINPENVTHITAILRNMYSAPDLAVIREYAANAVDAHVQMGRPDLPIRVTLPSALVPVFKVRDFGPGLTVEETKSLLYGFGSSGEHKRSSNEQIGGFGIGCKCAFAIAETFTYTVWNGGKKRIWTCYLDELDNGKASLQSEQDCDLKETGIEVSIPVSVDSIDDFRMYATTAFRFFRTKPEVLGLPADEDILFGIPEPTATAALTLEDKTDGSKWPITVKFFTQACESDNDHYYTQRDRAKAQAREFTGGVVMGGIRYAFSWTDCGVEDKQNTGVKCMTTIWQAIARRIVIEAPIGWVQLAPNREALQYSKRTKAMFQALFSVFTTAYMNKLFNVDAPDIDLGTRMRRVAQLQVLLDSDGSRYARSTAATDKLFVSCLKKYAPNWEIAGNSYRYVGSIPSLVYTGNVDAWNERTDASKKADWALVQQVSLQATNAFNYDVQHHVTYLRAHDPSTIKRDTASLDSAQSDTIVGNLDAPEDPDEVRSKCLVHFVSNGLVDELRCTAAADTSVSYEKAKLVALTAYRKMLYSDSHEKLLTTLQTDNGYNVKMPSVTVLTFRVKDDAARQAVIDSFGFTASETLMFSDEILTELPEKDALKEYRFYKRKPVSNRKGGTVGTNGMGVAVDGRTTYKQHGAKLFKISSATNPHPMSQGWEVLSDIDDLGWADKDDDFEMPILELDRFCVSGKGVFGSGDIHVYQNDAREFIQKLQSSGLAKQLLGVDYIPAARSSDIEKMQKDGAKFKSLGLLLKEKVLDRMRAHKHFALFLKLAGTKRDEFGHDVSDEHAIFKMFCEWCASVAHMKLNASDKLKAVIKKGAELTVDPVKDWIMTDFLDNKEKLFEPFILLAHTLYRHSGIEIEAKKLDALDNTTWYHDAVLTVITECPVSWPLFLSDRSIGAGFHGYDRCSSGHDAVLIAAMVGLHAKDDAERNAFRNQNSRRYYDTNVCLQTTLGKRYLKEVVLSGMTKQVTAETKETE